MNLSKNFTLAELTHTDTGLANEPNDEQRANLARLAGSCESVRSVCGSRRMICKSAFRSKAVNAKVLGSATSAHMHGLALDFIVEGQPISDTFRLIRHSGIVYDQLILEPTWVHFGLSDGKPRQQAIIKTDSGYAVAP